MNNRFFAVAEAYGIHKDETSLEGFHHLCNFALIRRSMGRKYDVFRPHVQRGLEFGAIHGDVKKWIEISRNTCKYRYGKTLTKFKDIPDFQAKYRHRLLEVIHSLDLDLEHLVTDDESDFIKTGFSPKFFENFLSECCGITVNEEWGKKSFLKDRDSKLASPSQAEIGST